MSDNPKMKDFKKSEECFTKHNVEETRYEHHFEEAEVEYQCNTCGRKIYLSYILDGVSVEEEK